ILAVAGLLTTQHFLRMKMRSSEGQNDIAGFLFTTMGVLYAVVLAFVVFAVWEQFARGEQAVTAEAAALISVFRDTQDFPAPYRLNPVWAVYRKVGQTRALGAVQYADVLTQLHALELQRHLRHLSGEASLPNVFWWILVLGAVGTVAFTYVFQMANLRLHAGM